MDEVGNEVEVALGASPSALRRERLLVGKPEEEEADVVDQDQE